MRKAIDPKCLDRLMRNAQAEKVTLPGEARLGPLAGYVNQNPTNPDDWFKSADGKCPDGWVPVYYGVIHK